MRGCAGCSLPAVQKAIKSKRITLLPDGSIDPERANQEWAKNTFAGARPDGRRLLHAVLPRSLPRPQRRRPCPNRPAA